MFATVERDGNQWDVMTNRLTRIKQPKTAEEILHEYVDKECMDYISENVWPDILEAMEEKSKHTIWEITAKLTALAEEIDPYQGETCDLILKERKDTLEAVISLLVSSE